MADGSVKIEVGLNIAKAERDLAKLKDKINKAEAELNANSEKKSALAEKIGEIGARVEEVRKRIRKLKDDLKQAGTADEKDLIREQLADARDEQRLLLRESNRLDTEYDNLNSRIQQGTESLEEMTEQAGEMADAIEDAQPKEAIADAMESAEEGIKGFFKNFLKIATLSKLIDVLKGKITDAFDEYLKFDDELQNNIDLLDATNDAIKTSIGSSLASIYSAVLPVIQKIANWTLQAANSAAKFVAILSGKSSYKRFVVDTEALADNLEDTADAASEAKRQIMGFDELNVLSDNSSSSSSSSGDTSTVKAIEEEIDEMDDSKLAKVARALSSLSENLKKLLSGDISFADFIGELDGLQTALLTIIGGGLLLTFISLVSKIPVVGTAAASILTLLVQEMTLMAETFTLVYGAIKAYEAVETYKEAGEAYENEIDTALTNYEKLYREKGKDVADQWAKMVYQIDTSSMTLAQAQQALTERVEELWGDAPNNCKEGWTQGWDHYFGKNGAGLWQLIEDAFTGIIDFIKEILGIHSPSTIFSDIARDCVQGLWNGWQEKWNAFITYMQGRWTAMKNWWSGLSLDGFRIKTPHLSWSTKQASGWIASTLSALGLPSAIPQLSVRWYARGGVFDRASLIGVGENGKEAVVPLENNTSWMQMVADGLMERIEQSGFAEQLATAFSSTPRPAMASGSVVPPNSITDYSPSAGIEDAVRRGVFDALSITSSGGQGEERQPINVYIGDEKIASYILHVNNRNSLITGGR